MVGKRAPLFERFEAKFERGAPDECWPWLASGNGAGYGMVWDQEKGRKVLATRVSYELYKGQIPSGGLILHSCDNPICVNPNHLRVGTHKHNIADMDSRGRRVFPQMKGEANPTAKLTDAQVIEIRRAYVAGEHRDTIAARYGLSPLSIPDLVGGKGWKHLYGVEGAPTLDELKAASRRNQKAAAKVTQEIAAEIRRRLAAGELGKDLAIEYGIHKATVSDIKLRKIWAD